MRGWTSCRRIQFLWCGGLLHSGRLEMLHRRSPSVQLVIGWNFSIWMTLKGNLTISYWKSRHCVSMRQLACREWQDSAPPNMTREMCLPIDDQKTQEIPILEKVSLSVYCPDILQAMVMGARLYPDFMGFSK